MSIVRTRGLCRMCGERYAGLESIDIYEPRGEKPAYYVLLRDLLNLNPHRGDMKPDRLGITCARLLDEWSRFRDKCTKAQKLLSEKCALKRQQDALINAANAAAQPQASCSGSQSTEVTPASASGSVDCNTATASGSVDCDTPSCSTSGSYSKPAVVHLKRRLSSDSDDSDVESEPMPSKQKQS